MGEDEKNGQKKPYEAVRIGCLFLLITVAVGGIYAAIINPRILAPLGLGFMALCHSAGRNWHPVTVWGDIIVWIGVSYTMFSWIMEGF